MQHFLKVYCIAYVTLALFVTPVIADNNRSASQLVDDIQSGGYVLYVRHAATDHSQKDSNRNDLSDCSSQRNLSSKGREDATRIGKAIKKLHIPIKHVSSSPYCRAKETAQLMFNSVLIDKNLQFSISKNSAESKRLGAYLKKAMLAATPDKSNVVFVGHTSNLKDGLAVWPKPEGVMVVFKPSKQGMLFKGMIKPSDWPD